MRKSLLLCALAFGCAESVDVPRAPIELLVDKLGITHVSAENEHDAFFGMGYAMARDRLFQMEVWRRQAFGRQAEIFGSALVRNDMGARVLGFSRLGVADFARMKVEHPDDATLIEAWAAGINRRIDEIAQGKAPRPYGLGKDELDFLPEKWTAAHAFAVGKVLAFGNSNTLDQDLLASVARALVPDVAEIFPLSMPTFDAFITPLTPRRAPIPRREIGYRAHGALPEPQWLKLHHSGSNNWAVDGAHSDNGRPWIAGDPHQATTSPSRLWPVHVSGGTLDVIGFAFPGTPAIELGHNARVAWTGTTSFADVMDLWDVEPSNDRKSLTLGDGVHAIVARNETICVKDADCLTLTVEEVPGYGVILPPEMLPVPSYFFTPHEVLFNWTGFAPTLEALAYLSLDRAQTLDEFDRAVDALEVGGTNFIAADASGISLRSHAVVPDRGDPGAAPMPWHILDGKDAATLWTRGALDGGRLPRARNPSRGWLGSANNDPFGFTGDGSVENDPWYYGAYFATATRARRIEERLGELMARPISRAEMIAMQNDTHSVLADALVPRLAEAMAGANRADLQPLAARLFAWNREMQPSLSEPVIFLGWMWFATRRAFAEPFTAQLFDAIVTRSPTYLIGQLPNVVEGRFPGWERFAPGGVPALLVGALDDTATWLAARFGDRPFSYADFSAAEFDNPYGRELKAGRVPVGGGPDTLFVAEGPFFGAGGVPVEQVVTDQMSLYRMVVGFAADGTPEATVNFARGASEEPSSPHFADQQARWTIGEHQPLPFRRADVEAAAESRVRLH